MNYEALVLAAGFSSRMGVWKPGLPLEGSTVIQQALASARSVCQRIVLVGGHHFSRLQELFSGDSAVVLVENGAVEAGMLLSVQLGVKRIEAERFFIALGDMPFVRPETYRLLALEAEKRGPRDRAAYLPGSGGRTGHPLLLHRDHISTIEDLDCGKHTLRNAVDSFLTINVEVEDPGTRIDLDTPEDYRRFAAD